MHHDDTTLPEEPLQSVFDLDRREHWVGIPGHDIPENELETEGAGHLDGFLIELPIGRAKQRRVMTILGFEKANRSENLVFLLLRRMERQMSMDFSVGTDFKERNLEESPYLLIVFGHPSPGHEECGRNLLLNQIVDQYLIVARSVTDGAEVERQGDSGARGRA
jgi:hypothetical protein